MGFNIIYFDIIQFKLFLFYFYTDILITFKSNILTIFYSKFYEILYQLVLLHLKLFTFMMLEHYCFNEIINIFFMKHYYI